jgi:hypothetical protein
MNIKKAMIKKLKKNLEQDNEVTLCKMSIFEVPLEFWQCGKFDTFYFKQTPYASIPFSTFAKNRDNFEYIKEFNRLNCYAPTYCLKNSLTGDIL